jgi:hypothetical protein
VAGFPERGNEPSGFMNGDKYGVISLLTPPQRCLHLVMVVGFCDSGTRRAMPPVPAGPSMSVRSKGTVQTKRDTLVLQDGGWTWG